MHAVRHTMKKGERMGQWYSRTQIGRAQVLAMSKDEIALAVRRADERNRDHSVQEPRPAKIVVPKK